MKTVGRLLLAPVLGGLFVLFLPAIGFALVLHSAVTALARAAAPAPDTATRRSHP